MRMKKIGAAGLLSFFVTASSAVSGFATETETAAAQQPGFISSILGSAKISLTKFGLYLPKLAGLLLILVAGALIAVGIAILIEKFLKLIRLEKGAAKIKIPEILRKGSIGLSLSELITEIAFFLIIIGSLIAALEFYGLTTSVLTGRVLSYIPHVIAAMFILILGIFMAILIGGIITLAGGNMRIAQAATLGRIAKYAIIIFVGLLALKEVGLNIILTDRSSDIILGSLALGSALAFGLGAKDKAGKFIDNIFRN